MRHAQIVRCHDQKLGVCRITEPLVERPHGRLPKASDDTAKTSRAAQSVVFMAFPSAIKLGNSEEALAGILTRGARFTCVNPAVSSRRGLSIKGHLARPLVSRYNCPVSSRGRRRGPYLAGPGRAARSPTGRSTHEGKLYDICERCSTENLDGVAVRRRVRRAPGRRGRREEASGTGNSGSPTAAARSPTRRPRSRAARRSSIRRRPPPALSPPRLTLFLRLDRPDGRRARTPVIERGRSAGKQFPLSDEESQIGRWDADGGIFPDVDLDADDPEAKVSRRHARIMRRNGQYFIEDLGSTNGTFINRGRRLLPGDRQPLRDGDEIIVGKTFLRFHIVQ